MQVNRNSLLMLVSRQVPVYDPAQNSLWRLFPLIAGPYSVCYWSHLFSSLVVCLFFINRQVSVMCEFLHKARKVLYLCNYEMSLVIKCY